MDGTHHASDDEDDKRAEVQQIVAPHVLLHQLIKNMGLTQAELADRLGYSRQIVNQILNGKHDISWKVSQALGRITGHDPEYWAKQKTQYDEWAGTCEVKANTSEKIYQPIMSPGILVDHQIISEVNAGNIVITEYVESNVQPATYDLTLGCAVVGDEDITVLNPGDTAHIAAKEYIEIPIHYAGRFGPCSRMTRAGIGVFVGCQIDPGYKGRLIATVFNFSKKPFKLEKGDKVLSIEFHKLSGIPTRPYQGRYLGETEISPSLRKVFNATLDGYYVSNNKMKIHAIHIDHVMLKKDIEMTLWSSGENYAATHDDLNLSVTGNSYETLYEEVCKRIIERYDLLTENKDKLAGPLKREFLAYGNYLQVYSSITYEQLKTFYKRMSWKWTEKDGFIEVIVTGAEDVMLSIITLPSGKPVDVDDLSKKLGIGRDQLLSAVDGTLTKEDFNLKTTLSDEL